jgi:predicted KAP-like P-loop ATPase
MANWFKKLWAASSAALAIPKAVDTRKPESPPPGPAGTEEYSSDQPIRSKEEDRFNRWPFANRIAEILAARRDPSSLVIAIYGPWGDGKTSTLLMMEDALKKHEHVTAVTFNPWIFDSEDQLLRGFFAGLAEALGKSLSTKKEELGQLLHRYGGVLALASGAAGAAAKSVGEALSPVKLDDLRRRLESLLEEGGRRIVVLIDDIDRLDRREIQAIFRLVKLSAGFAHTSYVLAFDDEVVSASLGERYGTGSAESGRAFLEKIVQVPLRLPPPDELTLRQLAIQGVEEALRVSGISLTEEQGEAFGRHFVDGLERRVSTPRRAKLYGNGLIFALPILKGEVNPVDQMLIEGIRIFYPRLYDAIRQSPEYFLNAGREATRDEPFKQRAKETVERALEADGVDDKDTVRAPPRSPVSATESGFREHVLWTRLGRTLGTRAARVHRGVLPSVLPLRYCSGRYCRSRGGGPPRCGGARRTGRARPKPSADGRE